MRSVMIVVLKNFSPVLDKFRLQSIIDHKRISDLSLNFVRHRGRAVGWPIWQWVMHCNVARFPTRRSIAFRPGAEYARKRQPQGFALARSRMAGALALA